MQNPHTDARVVILGGGLTGISTAFHLRRPWLLVEKEARLGGHARTDETRGFHFDKTGHWLHLRDPYMKQLVAELLPGQMVPVARKARIFSHGVLTRYPFQGNLHGLPPEVVSECLIDFVRAHNDPTLAGAGEELRRLLPEEVRRRDLAPLHDSVQPEAVGRAPARDHRRVVLALRAHPEARGRDQGRRRRCAAGDRLQRLVPLSEEGRHRDDDARAGGAAARRRRAAVDAGREVGRARAHRDRRRRERAVARGGGDDSAAGAGGAARRLRRRRSKRRRRNFAARRSVISTWPPNRRPTPTSTGSTFPRRSFRSIASASTPTRCRRWRRPGAGSLYVELSDRGPMPRVDDIMPDVAQALAAAGAINSARRRALRRDQRIEIRVRGIRRQLLFVR